MVGGRRGVGMCGSGVWGWETSGFGDVSAWGLWVLGRSGLWVMGASGLGTRGSEMSEDIGFGDIQE